MHAEAVHHTAAVSLVQLEEVCSCQEVILTGRGKPIASVIAIGRSSGLLKIDSRRREVHAMLIVQLNS